MGQRGPTRQPGSVRWYREGRHRYGRNRSELPDKPECLSPEASKVWDELVPQLYLDGIPILKVDAFALEIICETRAWMLELRREMADKGIVLKGPRGKLYVNPQFKLLTELSKQFLAWSDKFGMHPLARQRLDLVQPDYDPREAVMAGFQSETGA